MNETLDHPPLGIQPLKPALSGVHQNSALFRGARQYLLGVQADRAVAHGREDNRGLKL